MRYYFLRYNECGRYRSIQFRDSMWGKTDEEGAKKNSGNKGIPTGRKNSTVDELIEKGKIRLTEDGNYEVFSKETRGTSGEIAYAGDYIKIDSSGSPYPNSREFFEENHVAVGYGAYRQKAKEVSVWMDGDPINEEVRYLMEHKGLTLNEDMPDRYFQAPLWGTRLSASRDAVIVFYQIQWDENGEIADAEFNFVARDEFDKTYDMLPEE